MRPTYDQLFEMVQIFSKANFELQETVKRLQKRVNELEERLGLNSKNSSKPPSTDQKKNKQKPKGGAVKGHQGHHRKLVKEVDKRVFSPVDQCEHCGSKALKKRGLSNIFDVKFSVQSSCSLISFFLAAFEKLAPDLQDLLSLSASLNH